MELITYVREEHKVPFSVKVEHTDLHQNDGHKGAYSVCIIMGIGHKIVLWCRMYQDGYQTQVANTADSLAGLYRRALSKAAADGFMQVSFRGIKNHEDERGTCRTVQDILVNGLTYSLEPVLVDVYERKCKLLRIVADLMNINTITQVVPDLE